MQAGLSRPWGHMSGDSGQELTVSAFMRETHVTDCPEGTAED